MIKLPVICDLCSVDWTNRTESGGLVVCGWGICPNCETSMRENIEKEHEENTINSECPKDLSYADYIYKVRSKTL